MGANSVDAPVLPLDFEMSKLSSRTRVARLAGRQFGRVSWIQLKELAIPDGTVRGWIVDGYLYRELPHVYAVGNRARTIESDLAAALLYAGPGAALSHATATWWLGLLDERPPAIHVSTPRQCRSLPGIRVHGRRVVDRILYKRLAVTTIPQALVDFAPDARLRTVRRALAKADFQRVLDIAAIEAIIGRGGRSAVTLRVALERHQPRLVWTKSGLEIALLELCEEEGIPVPEVNLKVCGWEVDALWREPGLAVELDGHDAHHTSAQLRTDRRKEMALRSFGLTPIRYSGDQLKYQKKEVAAELRKLIQGPS